MIEIILVAAVIIYLVIIFWSIKVLIQTERAMKKNKKIIREYKARWLR